MQVAQGAGRTLHLTLENIVDPDNSHLFAAMGAALEAGDAAARELRVPAKGFPGRGKNPSGDLVVHLQPVFPTALGKKQRKALLEAEALLQAKAETMLPDVATWRRSYLPD